MKTTSTWYYLYMLTGFLVITPLKSGIDLDDKRLIRWATPSFTYQPETQQLHVTLNNVEIRCCGSCKSHGKLIGTFLNPAFKPFKESFDLKAPAPLCRVYAKKP